ncbi:RsfS/YbeB/iojap family protein, partial [Dysgonomonas sp. OttesenSCG-928-D17]|nr:RsfS/YbeB/iojap family protein [Dysgonomonas sp. OttesenSCG-928-D17]
LMQGLLKGKLDIIATDHAPHLLEEKQGGALKAASGGPLVQHSLQMMLELAKKGKISKEQVVTKMCHAPAIMFQVHKRGFIRKGYYADLVLVNPNKPYTITQERPLSIDGLREARWVGIDYGTVIVHVFLPELREFYNIEHLWADAKLESIPDFD